MDDEVTLDWSVVNGLVEATAEVVVHDQALDAARALTGTAGELRVTLLVNGADARLGIAAELPNTSWSGGTGVVKDDVAAAVDELIGPNHGNGPEVAVLMTLLNAPGGRAVLVDRARRLWARVFDPPLVA